MFQKSVPSNFKQKKSESLKIGGESRSEIDMGGAKGRRGR